MKQLPDDIHKEITSLCKNGDELAKEGKLEEAKKSYVDALRLLPQEHREWEAATWIYVAIGDIHFSLGNNERAFKCFYNAVQCPKGLGNPYIHLRLGQLYFEQGNLDKAADELTRAYMGGGMDIFMEDDPKYLEFLETRIEI
ncbi:tetratricopeptide repeat protein [Fluviicoccus keumensis]|uniref:Tetratricopeptide repeat protein n=2 Tax=Fluviicoccus keumensis TaxID=1435465 RepID=A0A4Q7YLN3_9GAMM|nr:tetratricopeptide repeat protein [Fluviicoccus keumensis]